MPTPVDRTMQSRSMFFGFAGLITAAAVWTIWGQDMFPNTLPVSRDGPPASKPSENKSHGHHHGKTGADHNARNTGEDAAHQVEHWSNDELKQWLTDNKLMAGETATRAELTAMVLTAMRAPSA